MGTPSGKLFGSVSAFEIASVLQPKGFNIDKKFIQIKTPIKSTGTYKIQIDFGKDTKAEIELSVLSEKQKQEDTKKENTSAELSKSVDEQEK